MRANLTMLMDFYELTMGNGYFLEGLKDRVVVFDMFFRKIPDDGGYAIMAGVHQMVDYLKNLKFTEEDIEYLREKQIFNESFLEYLKNFKFTCDVWAVPEGTPIFPNEPIVVVKGPAIEAQFIETMVLLTINHQSLIATKASRIVRVSEGRGVVEFGSRRSQSYDAAILGARASYIGGCLGTACTISEQRFNIPVFGTMAHSWIQMFPSEYEAFKAYAQYYPDNSVFLVDTYNVIKSGLPNAIKVAKEILEPMGKRLKAIRIDSGDIAYLSKTARKILDKADMKDCKIMASNSLDEFIIKDLILQRAKVDLFGVGERLITSKSEPVFGGVYKLVAIEENNRIIPKIKISENVEKITNPHFKMVYRLFDKDSNKVLGDVITLADEMINEEESYELFNPVYTWKRKKVNNFKAVPLLEKIFDKGICIYKERDIDEIRNYCKQQQDTLWEETLRLENPQEYYVDLSENLWQVKDKLLKKTMI